MSTKELSGPGGQPDLFGPGLARDVSGQLGQVVQEQPTGDMAELVGQRRLTVAEAWQKIDAEIARVYAWQRRS